MEKEITKSSSKDVNNIQEEKSTHPILSLKIPKYSEISLSSKEEYQEIENKKEQYIYEKDKNKKKYFKTIKSTDNFLLGKKREKDIETFKPKDKIEIEQNAKKELFYVIQKMPKKENKKIIKNESVRLFKINKECQNRKIEEILLMFETRFNKYCTKKFNLLLAKVLIKKNKYFFNCKFPLLGKKFKCRNEVKTKNNLSKEIKELINDDKIELINDYLSQIQKKEDKNEIISFLSKTLISHIIEYCDYIYDNIEVYKALFLDKKFVSANNTFKQFKYQLINDNYLNDGKKLYGYLTFYEKQVVITKEINILIDSQEVTEADSDFVRIKEGEKYIELKKEVDRPQKCSINNTKDNINKNQNKLIKPILI